MYSTVRGYLDKELFVQGNEPHPAGLPPVDRRIEAPLKTIHPQIKPPHPPGRGSNPCDLSAPVEVNLEPFWPSTAPVTALERPGWLRSQSPTEPTSSRG